jgi:hypothetical protein
MILPWNVKRIARWQIEKGAKEKAVFFVSQSCLSPPI